MMPYDELAGNFNKIAGSNIVSGNEPLSIAARRRMNTAQQGIRMNSMDMQNRLKQMALQQQEDEIKQSEDPLFDILGLLSGGASVAHGIGAKDKAGRESRALYDRFLGGA